MNYYDEEYDVFQDDINYEEETFYALGGIDYDAFRESGGSIDDMMDALGY